MSTDTIHFAKDAKMAAAVKPFEVGKLTSRQAARFAGVGRQEFLLGCRQWGVDSVSWDADEIEAEFTTPLPNSVVCNAGPLIALSGIGQIGLLHELFGELLISGEMRGRGY